jgi:hypothetical protein
MSKLKLAMDDLRVESFETTSGASEKGTVFGEQCTCRTVCTCPGCNTCDATCPNTCAYTCDDSECMMTCIGETCMGGGYTCWDSCGYTCQGTCPGWDC